MVDFRQLNRATTFDSEPIPNPEAIFATLSKDHVFSKLDCSKYFWQIAMHAKEEKILLSLILLGYSCFDECHLDWSTPEHLTEVYSKLINCCYPFNELNLEKRQSKKVVWSENADRAFKELKAMLCSSPILKLLEFDRFFFLEHMH